MDLIVTEQLRHIYTSDQHTVEAVSCVDLTIEPGEFVAIIGHNGSGKSTLARHFNATLLPSSGQVRIRQMDTQDPDKLWDIRQTVGLVLQNPDNQLVATIVEDDVAFGPENLGVCPQQIRRRVDESLYSVGMLEYAGRAPHLLSGGQKQRIAIAGILAMRPDCLVLDESTAMLDPGGRQEVMETVCRLNQEEGMTVIHITHFMEEAVLANRVVVMDQGRIQMQGSPREIFSQVEKLRLLGLDVPQMTELSYELAKAGLPIAGDLLTVKEMVEFLCP